MMNCDTKLWLITEDLDECEVVQTTWGKFAAENGLNLESEGCAEIARLLERKGFYSRGGDGAQPHYRLEPVSVAEETACFRNGW
jgi:hypothetical protein